MAHSQLGSALQRARFLAPGDRLGKHDLIRQIAVGGMAEIYLARTTGIEGFEKLAVVKRILPQYASNASFVSMFLNEARLAATFQHPNIAQVYDIGQEQGEFFFSMEYVHGEDLGRLVAGALEQGVPISVDAALTLVAGLCAGLHHAHEKASPEGKPLNVVHRDVSPSNVLVSYDGAVKLVDFGIARVNTTPTTSAGGLKGKISYMSPEQCRGNGPLDRRSDIFSIGTILYELTTGQLPFNDDSEYAVLNMIVNTDAPPPSRIVPGYPPALETIVMKALARDPMYRYTTALELQGHLEDFAHDNRLRVSPLVLARLMSTLFPARLEEWAQARDQGAFFVEQHVVRTLIESGKTGESPSINDSIGTQATTLHNDSAGTQATTLHAVAGAIRPGDDDDSTAVTEPPIGPDDVPTSIHAPLATPTPRGRTPVPEPPNANATVRGIGVDALLPARLPTPVPRVAAAVPGMPGAVPIYAPQPGGVLVSNPGHAPPPGVLVGSAGAPPGLVQPAGPPQPAYPTMKLPPLPPPSFVASAHVGEVTERVRVPTPVAGMGKKRNPMRLVALAIGGTVAAALITYLALSSGSDPMATPAAEPAKPEPTASPAIAAPATADPVPAKAESAKPDSAKDSPEAPTVEPAKPAEPVKAVEVAPAKPDATKPEPKVDDEPKPTAKLATRPTKPAKPAVRPKPKTEPKPKPEPKEQSWSGDSPFMPVRAEKK